MFCEMRLVFSWSINGRDVLFGRSSDVISNLSLGFPLLMKSFFGLRIELVYDGIFVKKTKFLYKRSYNSTKDHIIQQTSILPWIFTVTHIHILHRKFEIRCCQSSDGNRNN